MKNRFYNKLYAKLNRYFWLPCPNCGAYFGGHEWGNVDGKSSVLIINIINDCETSEGICPDCTMAGVGDYQNKNFRRDYNNNKRREKMQKFENGQEVEFYSQGTSEWRGARYIGRDDECHILQAMFDYFPKPDEFVRPVEENSINYKRGFETGLEQIKELEEALELKDDAIKTYLEEIESKVCEIEQLKEKIDKRNSIIETQDIKIENLVYSAEQLQRIISDSFLNMNNLNALVQ